MFIGFSFVAPNLLEKCVAQSTSNQLKIRTIDRPIPEEVINFNETVKITSNTMYGDRTKFNCLLILVLFHILQSNSFMKKYHFTSKEPIGDGTFSICMRCKRPRGNREYAVKILNSKQSTCSEVKALRKCRNHPNIVQFVDVVTDNAYTYIVTELISGDELFQRAQLQHFGEDEVKMMFAQLVDAVQYLHSNGIIHRDLKLENIMVIDEESGDVTLKIVDFGFSCAKDSPNASVVCYTLDYVAPEVLANEMATEACDLWSLGVILYTLLCGRKPFRAEPRPRKDTNNQIKNRIRTASFDCDSNEWYAISEPARDLITKLLTVNVEQRASILDVANHSWLNGDVINETVDEVVNETFDEAVKGEGVEAVDDSVEAVEYVTNNSKEITEELHCLIEEDSIHVEKLAIDDGNTNDGYASTNEESNADNGSKQCEVDNCIEILEGSNHLDEEAIVNPVDDGANGDVETMVIDEAEQVADIEEAIPSHSSNDSIEIVECADPEPEPVSEPKPSEPEPIDTIPSKVEIATSEDHNRRSMSVESTTPIVIQDDYTDAIVIDDAPTIDKTFNNNNDKFIEVPTATVVHNGGEHIPIEEADNESLQIVHKKLDEDEIDTLSLDSKLDQYTMEGFQCNSTFSSQCKVIDLTIALRNNRQLGKGICASIIRRRSSSSGGSDHDAVIFKVLISGSDAKAKRRAGRPRKRKQRSISSDGDMLPPAKKTKKPTPAKKKPAATPTSIGAPKRITRNSLRRPEIQAERPTDVGIDVSS